MFSRGGEWIRNLLTPSKSQEKKKTQTSNQTLRTHRNSQTSKICQPRKKEEYSHMANKKSNAQYWCFRQGCATHWIQSEGSSAVRCFSFSAKNHLKCLVEIKNKGNVLFIYLFSIKPSSACWLQTENPTTFTWLAQEQACFSPLHGSEEVQFGHQRHMSETVGLALFPSLSSN